MSEVILSSNSSTNTSNTNNPRTPYQPSVFKHSTRFETQHLAHEDNSRPFDVHRWSNHPEVNQFVYKLWDDEFAHNISGRGKPPLTNPKYQFKVLILDLFVAWKQDPSLRLGIGLSKRFYKASTRYNALHISSIMIDLVHAVHKSKYIKLRKGTEASGKVTRIWPTRHLIQLFEAARFSEYDIGVVSDYEVIILNNKDGDEPTAKPVEYADSDYEPIPQMRRDVQAYNALLNDTFIDIGSLESSTITSEYWDSKSKTHRNRKVHVRQNNKLVRRVFYRGSWELGGRYHGGWWQQIDSSYRKDILINDQRTIEVDYSGLHISLIYCLEGQSPPRDPYDLPLLLTGYKATEQRKVVKGLVLCAINAKSATVAFQAFRNEQDNGTKQKTLKNGELKILLDAFISRNPVVKNYIAMDKGVELMRLDGKITAYIINYFTKRNIPILTVHDSYIVPEDMNGELVRVMQKAVCDLIGDHTIRATQDTVNATTLLTFAQQDPMHRYYYLKDMMAVTTPVRCSGYIERRDNFLLWKQQVQVTTSTGPG